jgi:C-terminal processing protease CtpA/Prc
VKTVVAGGPADKCGRIRVGDELLAVNGSYVAGLPLHNVFKLVLGEDGTLVTLDVCQVRGADMRAHTRRAFAHVPSRIS